MLHPSRLARISDLAEPIHEIRHGRRSLDRASLRQTTRHSDPIGSHQPQTILKQPCIRIPSGHYATNQANKTNREHAGAVTATPVTPTRHIAPRVRD